MDSQNPKLMYVGDTVRCMLEARAAWINMGLSYDIMVFVRPSAGAMLGVRPSWTTS